MSAFRVGPSQAEVIDVKSLSGVHMKLVKTVRIHPYALWRQIWGGFITLLLVYNMIVIPVAVGFVLNDSPGTFTMNRVIDVCFIIDIFLNFETGVVSDDSIVVEMERNRVRSSYLRGAFIVDFISAIPLDVILIYGFNQRYMTDVRDTNVGVNSIVVRLIVRGMKILRLLKSINIMKAFDRFEKAALISLDAAEFVRFFIVTFFVLHWAACIFAFIDTNVCPQDPYYSAFVANGINEWSYLDRYVAALYWALQTVVTIGYGDVNARCTANRCFGLSVMFLGSVGYAYGISMVMTAMQKQREKHREIKELMVSVEEYANFIKLPTSLRMSVREYFAFINARNEFIHEKLILDQLSPDLKGLVLHHVNSSLITSVRLFTLLSEIEPEPRHLVVDVIAALQSQVLRPDEVVISEGDVSSNFYIVSKGALCVFKWNVLKLDTIEAGNCFGEACFLAPYLTPFSTSASAAGSGSMGGAAASARYFNSNGNGAYNPDNMSDAGDVISLSRRNSSSSSILRGGSSNQIYDTSGTNTNVNAAKSIDILEGHRGLDAVPAATEESELSGHHHSTSSPTGHRSPSEVTHLEHQPRISLPHHQHQQQHQQQQGSDNAIHDGAAAASASASTSATNTPTVSVHSAGATPTSAADHNEASAGFIRAARRLSNAVLGSVGGTKSDSHSGLGAVDGTTPTNGGGPGRGLKRRVSISQQVTGRIHGLVEQAEKLDIDIFHNHHAGVGLGSPANATGITATTEDVGGGGGLGSNRINVDYVDGHQHSATNVIDINGHNSGSSTAFRSSASSIPGLGGSAVDLNGQHSSDDGVYYQPYTVIATTYTGVRFLPQQDFENILRRYDRAKRKTIKRALRDRCIDVMDEIAAYEDELAEKFPEILQKYVDDLARLAAVENLLEGTPWDLGSLRNRPPAAAGDEKRPGDAAPSAIPRQRSGEMGSSRPAQVETSVLRSPESTSIGDNISLKVRQSMSNFGKLVGISSSVEPGPSIHATHLSSIAEDYPDISTSNSGALPRGRSGTLDPSARMHATSYSEKPTVRAISRADILTNPSTLSRVFAPPLTTVDEGYVSRLRKLSNATAAGDLAPPSRRGTDHGGTRSSEEHSEDGNAADADARGQDAEHNPDSPTSRAHNLWRTVRDNMGERPVARSRDDLSVDVEMVHTEVPGDNNAIAIQQRFFDANGVPRHQTDSALRGGIRLDSRPRQASYTPKRAPAADITDIMREDGITFVTGRNPLTGESRDEARAAAEELLNMSPQKSTSTPPTPQLRTPASVGDSSSFAGFQERDKSPLVERIVPETSTNELP